MKKINWKSIIQTMRNIVVAIGRGDLILRLRADKLFPYILYTFLLAWLSIWLSYKAEGTMLKVEQNMKEINDLKIIKAQKTSELYRFDWIGNLEEKLEENGSAVRFPQKPADRLD